MMILTGSGCAVFGINRVESLLINVGGKLLMLERLHEKERRKTVVVVHQLQKPLQVVIDDFSLQLMILILINDTYFL